MFTKTTREPKSGSVARTELGESSVRSGSMISTIRPSDEFLQIFELSCKVFRKHSTFTKNQMKTMESKMDNFFHRIINSRKAKLNDIIALAYSYQNICFLHGQLQQKEELRIAKNCALRCLNLIRDKELDPKSILIALKAYNNLGFIYCQQNKIEKAIQTLDKSVELYLTYTREIEKHGWPIDLEDIIINDPPSKLNGYQKLKNLYIFNLQTLIELHKSLAPANNHKLIRCSHLFLVAESSRLPETKTYVKWFKEAMELCNYLLKYNRFVEANSHFNAAIYIKRVFIDEPYNNMKGQEHLLKLLNLDVQSVIDANYYTIEYGVRYGLAILRRSAERLLRLGSDEDSDRMNLSSECPTKSKKLELLLFNEIEKGHPIPKDCFRVAVKYITDYKAAYTMFVIVLKYLYSKLPRDIVETNVMFYLQFTLYTCDAYKYMALYEKHTASQILLHDRRTDVLSNAIEVIYLKDPSEFPYNTKESYIKYFRIQLAIAYSSMIDIKFEHLERVHPLVMSQRYDVIMLEIKKLVENNLMNLTMFIESL